MIDERFPLRIHGALPPAFPRDLQKANKGGANLIAEETRRRYERRYTRRSGRGARSIRALATQTRAQVALGSQRVP